MSEKDMAQQSQDMLAGVLDADPGTETPTEGDTETDKAEETPETEEAETTDTETETPAGEDTETETVEELDPLIAAFKEEGLDKRYADPATALRSIRERDRHTQQLSQERAEMLRQLELARPKPVGSTPIDVTGQEFFDNPQAALEKLGFINRADVEKITNQKTTAALDQKAAEDFVSGTSDFEDYRADADRVLNEMPWLAGMPKLHLVKTCYEIAKARRVKPVEVTEPANQDKKSRAATSGGSGGTPAKSTAKSKAIGPHGMTAEDIATLPIEEIERRAGFGED